MLLCIFIIYPRKMFYGRLKRIFTCICLCFVARFLFVLFMRLFYRLCLYMYTLLVCCCFTFLFVQIIYKATTQFSFLHLLYLEIKFYSKDQQRLDILKFFSDTYEIKSCSWFNVTFHKLMNMGDLLMIG